MRSSFVSVSVIVGHAVTATTPLSSHPLGGKNWGSKCSKEAGESHGTKYFVIVLREQAKQLSDATTNSGDKIKSWRQDVTTQTACITLTRLFGMASLCL